MAKGLAEAARPPESSMGNGQPEGGKLTKDEMMDVKIAHEMMRGLLLQPQGKKVLLDSLSKPNPAPSLSIVMGSMVDKIAKKMEQKGLGLSPRAWLAKNGAVDRAMDTIADIAAAEDIAFDEQVQSQVFAGIIDQMKLAAQADANGEQPEEEAEPMMEEEGVPMEAVPPGPGAPMMPPGEMV